MASGIYTFRAENFTLDQQASTTNDSLILSIYYKIDDAVTKLALSVPIARQIYSGQMVDLGRWAETEPIEVAADSLITIVYQVINITGGWTDPFADLKTDLNGQILPALQAIGTLVDINVEAYTNAVISALDFIYNSSSAPVCSGLVHLHSDQYTGARLAELTADYAVHRVANSPSQTLTPPASGCNTPASRISLAVEAVPARLAATGPAKSSNDAIVIARSLPLGPTTAYLFNPANPTKYVGADFTLNDTVKGNISCVAPGNGNDKSVAPVHLYALKNSDGSILHASHDGSGWHDWAAASKDSGFGSLFAVESGSTTEIFAIDAGGTLVHSKVAADGTLSAFSGAAANPNPGLDYDTSIEVNPLDLKVWGNTTRITGLWTQGKGCNIYAGLPPVGLETEWGTRVAGGLKLNAVYTDAGQWTINWPYSDAEFPSFMMLGPDAITADGAYAIGHGGEINSNYDPSDPVAGASPYYSFTPPAPSSLPGPDAAQIASALNSSAEMLWLALMGTDQQIWVGASLIKQKAWFPGNGVFTNLGGPFSGRPLIFPDPSGNSNRTFFFVLGLDNNVYWKYFDFKSGETPLDGTFTPAGKQWASLPDKNDKVTLTGPTDPGPVLMIVDDPTKVLHNPPSLSVNFTRLAPGASLSVVGANFPLASATEVQVEWGNTSTGKAAGAQIKYEIKGKNTATPIDIPVPANFANYPVYTYTAKSLLPNTEYVFWARCSDSVGWSDWSKTPLSVTTNKSANVQLLMKPQNHPTTSVNLGNKDLSTSSSAWALTVTVPAATAVGAYVLSAQLDGGTLASANITLATTALVQLQFVDPKTNQVQNDPLVVGGSVLTVRGTDFPNGPISFGIEGKKVGSATAVNGAFTTNITIPAFLGQSFPSIPLTASGGGVSATANFQGPSPLK